MGSGSGHCLINVVFNAPKRTGLQLCADIHGPDLVRATLLGGALDADLVSPTDQAVCISWMIGQ